VDNYRLKIEGSRVRYQKFGTNLTKPVEIHAHIPVVILPGVAVEEDLVRGFRV
jgi:hypothetical protein